MSSTRSTQALTNPGPVLVVHGGASAAYMIAIDPAYEEGKKAGVLAATRAGYQVLSAPGGCALDSVQKAVEVLEEDPYANAGKGSVLTRQKRIQMDAVIMDGRTLNIGAVTAIQEVLHPIRAAKLVMEKTNTVMLCGEDATRFAHSNGVDRVPQEELLTEGMEKAWQVKMEKLAQNVTHPQSGHDTVGAVALDAAGNVAYASSSGGLSTKWDGRVGSSCIPGSGGYADNTIGAVTATGMGDSYTRTCLGYATVQAIKTGLPIQTACQESLDSAFARVGGNGGIIGVSRDGQVAVYHTTPAMPWAYVTGSLLHHGLYQGEHFQEKP